MKIRTNFVTNSSSYSSAEIKIDNPVLLKILKKYKDKGAFICDDGSDWGDGIGSSQREQWEQWDIAYEEDERNKLLNELDDTPVAFYLYNPEQADIQFAPNRIEDLVNLIMDVIVSEGYKDDLKNKTLFDECKKELLSHAQEINNNYIEVSWKASDESCGESESNEGDDTSWEFYYHK